LISKRILSGSFNLLNFDQNKVKPMSKKNKKWVNVVYSTNPDFQYEAEELEQEDTLSPRDQKLFVSIDRKQRAGKEVTLVEGFIGREEDVKTLGKEIKVKCGVGGTVKDNVILIQGNFKEKIFAYLVDSGFTATKKKGG
jgi:translation initiation factor 1